MTSTPFSYKILIAIQSEKVLEEKPTTPNLAVSVKASFPNAEVFGVKLVNNHATNVVLDFTNNEVAPVTITVIGAALNTLSKLPEGTPESHGIVRNLTSTKYGVTVPAGASETVPYSFTTELHPQDLRLQIIAVVKDKEGALYQVQAYNEKVSVVEAPTSFFDPQVYVLLLS